MKRIIKIIATLVTLIIVNYNMCFADSIMDPTISSSRYDLRFSIMEILTTLGIIFLIIYIILKIMKKEKKRNIINKCMIIISLIGVIDVLLLFGGNIFSTLLIIGIIIAIILSKNKYIKLSTIISGLVIIFLIIDVFFLTRPTYTEYDMIDGESFNAKFQQYEGRSLKYSDIRSLIQAVITNNKAQDDYSKKVELTIINIPNQENIVISEDEENIPKISSSYTYKVTCNISTNGNDVGLVQSILVECNGKTK